MVGTFFFCMVDNMSDKKEINCTYGGQAVIEGVMMRGKDNFAISVRKQDGEIISQTEPVPTLFKRLVWMKKPFLRGTLALIDSMYLGMKALMFSANIAMEDIEEEEAKKKGEETKPKSDHGKINDIAVGFTMVIGMLFAMGLFLLVPIILTKLLRGLTETSWMLSIIEGFIKIGIFVGYVWLISFMPDIKRVFKYHGAEHKTINAYEAGVPLTVENVKEHTKVHVRCGTSFIFVVLLASILILIIVADHLPHGSLADTSFASYFARWIYKILLLPIIAGISYEIIKFAGTRKDKLYTKLLLAPGLAMQKLTTEEPDDSMIEVAISSLKSVIDKENDAADCCGENEE